MAPSSPPVSSVLDVSVIEALRALGAPGEPDVYTEVALLFLEDVPIQMAALTAAIAAASADSVRQIAHRLRGSALEIGAIRMAPVCATIEYAARDGSLEAAAAQVETLELEFQSARATLQQVIQ